MLVLALLMVVKGQMNLWLHLVGLSANVQCIEIIAFLQVCFFFFLCCPRESLFVSFMSSVGIEGNCPPACAAIGNNGVTAATSAASLWDRRKAATFWISLDTAL